MGGVARGEVPFYLCQACTVMGVCTSTDRHPRHYTPPMGEVIG